MVGKIINILEGVLYYTGIGARATPQWALTMMTEIARQLSLEGHVLRSGGAPGADSAFEYGHAGNMEIFLPWDGFEKKYIGENPDIYIVPEKAVPRVVYNRAWEMARDIHPNWSAVSQGVSKMHVRNVFQILGYDLDTPSTVVVFWAPERNGVVAGGTATAIHLARAHGIPTFNLNNPEQLDIVRRRFGIAA